jgi:hypothetical protein
MTRSGWLWAFIIVVAAIAVYLFIQVVNPWFTTLAEVLGG